MWLLKLHIAISILCFLTAYGFAKACKSTIKENGWIADKTEKKKCFIFSAWIFFIPLLNILCVLIILMMISVKKSKFDEMVEESKRTDNE